MPYVESSSFVESAPPPSFKVAEYAAANKLNKATIYRMIARGELEVIRFGRAIRIPADAPLPAGREK